MYRKYYVLAYFVLPMRTVAILTRRRTELKTWYCLITSRVADH